MTKDIALVVFTILLFGTVGFTLLGITGYIHLVMLWDRRCWLGWRLVLVSWRVARIKARQDRDRHIDRLRAEIRESQQTLVTLAYKDPKNFLGD